MSRFYSKSSLSPAAVVFTVLAMIPEIIGIVMTASIFETLGDKGNPIGALAASLILFAIVGVAFLIAAGLALIATICGAVRLKNGNGDKQGVGIFFLVLDLLILVPVVGILIYGLLTGGI